MSFTVDLRPFGFLIASRDASLLCVIARNVGWLILLADVLRNLYIGNRFFAIGAVFGPIRVYAITGLLRVVADIVGSAPL
jgi:hypothetical protein